MCPTPCEFQNNLEFRQEGDNACRIGRWASFLTYVKAKKEKAGGLGDVVASVAEPIAGALDKVFKTKIKGCSACARRKDLLNEYVPLSFLRNNK